MMDQATHFPSPIVPMTPVAFSRVKSSRVQLDEFCRRNYIRKLSFFGSILRDDFGETSDIDVLVEFHPGRVPGLEFFAIQDELSSLLGRTVDLHTPESLSRYFRDKVLSEAQTQYVAA